MLTKSYLPSKQSLSVQLLKHPLTVPSLSQKTRDNKSEARYKAYPSVQLLQHQVELRMWNLGPLFLYTRQMSKRIDDKWNYTSVIL